MLYNESVERSGNMLQYAVRGDRLFRSASKMFGHILVAALMASILTSRAAAQSTDLIFAVTEGVTYQATPREIRDKFAPVADYVGKAIGRRIKVVLVPAYNDLRAGMAKQDYDMAFVHPAHVAMAEIKAGRYKAVAWTAGFTDYTVSLLMNANEPIRSLSDLNGRTVVTPDPDSITAVMVRAMFRTAKLIATSTPDPTPTSVRVITTRYQDAVPFYLEYTFAQVGATAAKSVVKAWTDKGGKVLAQSRSIPIKQFLVSTRMPAEEQDRIRDALIAMGHSKEGRDALDGVGYKGFVAPDRELESTTIVWLGI
jgi:phosphonate transport system substrate-binding protein